MIDVVREAKKVFSVSPWVVRALSAAPLSNLITLLFEILGEFSCDQEIFRKQAC